MSIKCICCGYQLVDLGKYQPSGGTAFHTYGHYGSAVTDHMDGTVTTVFVCDYCMESSIKYGVAKVDRDES